MANDQDADLPRPGTSWAEYYQQQAAALARLADGQAERARKAAALIDRGGDLYAALGIEPPTALIGMFQDGEQHARLGAQVCAAWALAAADFLARGGPGNPVAVAAWRVACDWYGALLADGQA